MDLGSVVGFQRVWDAPDLQTFYGAFWVENRTFNDRTTKSTDTYLFTISKISVRIRPTDNLVKSWVSYTIMLWDTPWSNRSSVGTQSRLPHDRSLGMAFECLFDNFSPAIPLPLWVGATLSRPTPMSVYKVWSVVITVPKMLWLPVTPWNTRKRQHGLIRRSCKHYFSRVH